MLNALYAIARPSVRRPSVRVSVRHTDVLNTCGIMGIEAFLLKAQLRWVSHIMRMPDRDAQNG